MRALVVNARAHILSRVHALTALMNLLIKLTPDHLIKNGDWKVDTKTVRLKNGCNMWSFNYFVIESKFKLKKYHEILESLHLHCAF